MGMYPFSISIDEHEPLNMGAGIFFHGGANSGFSKGGPKIFLQGEGQKVAKLYFRDSKKRKQPSKL